MIDSNVFESLLRAEQAEDATKSDGKMFMGQGIVVKVKGNRTFRASSLFFTVASF